MTVPDTSWPAKSLMQQPLRTASILLKQVLDNYAWIRKIEQVITDRGTQFYANKKDKNDESESRFEAFLSENQIKHIKARIKHPQTNGKVEKWFDLYEKIPGSVNFSE